MAPLGSDSQEELAILDCQAFGIQESYQSNATFRTHHHREGSTIAPENRRIAMAKDIPGIVLFLFDSLYVRYILCRNTCGA